MAKYLSTIIVMVWSVILANSALAGLVENKDYLVIDQPSIVSPSEEANIEVVEFFSFGCPYCAVLEPQIDSWLAQKPDHVTFTRIAIPRKGKWIEYARLFYALGMISPAEQERMTPLIYAAIHEQDLNFEDADEIFDWAASENIDRELLEKFYYSEEVTNKLSQAITLAHAYNLKYVPAIYVNQRYQLLIDSDTAYQDMPEKLNQLIEMENH